MDRKNNFIILFIFLLITESFVIIFHVLKLIEFLIFYLLTFITFIIGVFLLILYKKPNKVKKYLGKKKVYIFLDILKIALTILVEIIILITIMLTGYNPLSRLFLGLLAALVFLIYYYWAIENNWKMAKKVLIFLGLIIAFIGLQGVSPIFYPKISLIMDKEISYGWLEGNETYIAQYPTLEVYPALFPIHGYTNCQEFPLVGLKIKYIETEKYIPSVEVQKIINDMNTSIRVCTWYADAWMWNYISIPIYIRSFQKFGYTIQPENYNITYFYELETDKKYYYTNLYFSNPNNFKVGFVDPVFHIYNNTYTEKILESDCYFQVIYTENPNNFSSSNLKPTDSFGVYNKTTSEIRLFTIFLEPNEQKRIFVFFDPLSCK